MSKKRKVAANDQMERQHSALIPDMTSSYIKQEYAAVEASKSKDDTKQINKKIYQEHHLFFHGSIAGILYVILVRYME